MVNNGILIREISYCADLDIVFWVIKLCSSVYDYKGMYWFTFIIKMEIATFFWNFRNRLSVSRCHNPEGYSMILHLLQNLHSHAWNKFLNVILLDYEYILFCIFSKENDWDDKVNNCFNGANFLVQLVVCAQLVMKSIISYGT